MANMMPGQLRVDNNLGREVRVDSNVQQLPDTGGEKAFADVSRAFAGIGERVGQMADKAAAKEGALDGRAAGLDPEFRPVNTGTIRGDAFDKAGLDVAETRIRQQVEADFDAAYLKHAADPAGLQNALVLKRAGILQHVPEQLRPDIELLMRGKQLHFSREQARRAAAEAQAAAAAAVEQQMHDSLKGLHQRAYALGVDAQADEVLAADVGVLAKTLARRGPDGQRLISPAAARKQIDAVQETVATARLSGAFSRLPTLDAKAQFIKQFEDDFANSRGLSKVYDLQSFETVKNRLEADYRSAQTEQRAQISAVAEDVKAFQRSAEKGHALAPGDLAGLKSKVAATKDPALASSFAVAENTLAWQSAAARSTPAELEAHLTGLHEKLKTGATPEGEARLALGEKLLGHMRTELKQDPLGWADRVGVLKIAPLDFSSAEAAAATVKARVAQAETVAGVYGHEPKYLRPDEKQALATTMARGGPEALAVATTVAAHAGDRALGVMSELGDHAPVMAGLGAMVAMAGGGRPPQAVVDAFDALAARRERAEASGKTLPPVPMPSTSEIQTVLADRLGGALSADPRNEAAVVEAAKLVYEKRAAQGHFTASMPDAFAQAVSEVLGEQTIDGVKFGGIARQGGRWWGARHEVVLPPAVRQDALPDVMAMLTPAVFDQAGLKQPVTASGNQVSAERLRDATLVQSGNGRYLLALGDPATPGKEQFVQAASARAGETVPFELDFNRLMPVLAKRRPDLFLGAH